MRLSSFFFLVDEAGKSIRRNGLMSLAAFSAVTVALSVFGGAVFFLYRLHQFAAAQPQRFVIAVFLQDNASRSTSTDVERRIQGIPGVTETRLVTKEEALGELMEEDRKRGTRIVDALAGANPLPDRIDVRTASPERSRSVAAVLRNESRFPEVAAVRDEREMLDKLVATSKLVRTLSAIVAGLLLFATAVLVQNTLRLTVIARADEIQIMRLVGASPAFVRLPIVLEGIFYGVAGAIAASLVVILVLSQLSRYTARFESPLAVGMPPAPGPWMILVVLMATGLVLGLVTSVISLRRFLR